MLDDSTDETCEVAELAVRRCAAQGHDIKYIHRRNRVGFKAGALEEGLKTARGEFVAIFDAAPALRSSRIVGLMLLPPAVDDPHSARPYFRELKAVRDRLMARGVDGSMLQQLSMGMSHDFEVAVEEGSTMVRVGTAIFGGRSYVRP